MSGKESRKGRARAMNSIEDIKWEIETLERIVKEVSRQLQPTKELIWKLEDSVVETGKCLKEAQMTLEKAKNMVADLVHQTGR